MPDPDPDLDGGIPMPPHAYVPGVNARHPEGWFDSIKASVTPEMPVGALATTQAWRAGWLYFDAGFYWECHEVLEAVWMQTPGASAERDMVQAVIQLANARLKIRMQRPRAAWRLCAMVEAHLARCPREGAILGVPVARVSGLVYRTVKQLQNAK